MTCPHAPKRRLSRWWYRFTQSAFIFGLLSLIWFIARTGTKPSRAAYPCQRAAAASGYAWLATYALPLLPFAKIIKTTRMSRGAMAAVLALLLLLIGGPSIRHSHIGIASIDIMSPGVSLTLTPTTASLAPSSDIYVVEDAPLETGGIPELIANMSGNGLHFYQSASELPSAGAHGVIGRDDVVLIKVNCQWYDRGGTSTDLLKSLIQAIVDHPDGFEGEIIVADNGQRQYGSTNRGGSFDWTLNNAIDREQSIQQVVDGFAETHRVSTSLWDDITTTEVAEYDAGDTADGYVVVQPMDPRSDSFASYPKFQTRYGTYVSFGRGIWDSESQTYDSDRLVLINAPILKPHLIYGVTGCVKHYMGVTSDMITRRLGARAHDTIVAGGMGTVISGTRFPDLNILDALWVSLENGKGPRVSSEQVTSVRVVAASTDPVALDYWAGKHILKQGAEQLGYSTNSLNPDIEGFFPSAFSRYLESTKNILLEDGYQVTTDEDAMNVFITSR